MASGFFFDGIFSRRPVVRARVDDFGLTPFTIGSLRIVALIGEAKGGEPGVPQLFSTPSEAAKILRSGELLTAVKRTFDPSRESRGASQVYAVRVNPATVATLTLDDAGGGDAVVVTSRNWGLEENQIKVKVESGTTLGKKLTLAKGAEFYARDNVGRAAFSLQYVGAGTSATVTITGTALTTAITGGPGGETLNLDFATYDTVQQLADAIDAHPAYTAAVLTDTPTNPTADALDFVTAANILTALTIRADLQAVIDSLTTGGWQPLVKAARASGGDAPPVNIGFTFLSGGTEGTTLNSHWQAAFDALQSRDLAFVVPISSNAALHAMADTHCALMSADGKKPRRAFAGAALGEHTTDLSNYLNRAQALNSDRTALLAQGVKGFDDAGLATTFAPYIAAAQIAGMQAGVQTMGEAITFKSLNVTGIEWVPTTGDLEVLIPGGVLPLELAENRGFFRVTRGITTWRKNDAFHRVEISTGIALDEVIRAVVEGLEIFIGQKASPVIVHRIASRTESILLALQQQEVIVGDDDNPAFKDIQVSLTGDTALVDFMASPVVPLNFIGVTIHADVFRGVVVIATRQ